MIRLSPEAEAELDGLLAHYERLARPEAARNLLIALHAAMNRIERAPEAGLPAPRPYPALAGLGLRWLKESAYWIAYASRDGDRVIAGVFHDSANIPRRLKTR